MSRSAVMLTGNCGDRLLCVTEASKLAVVTVREDICYSWLSSVLVGTECLSSVHYEYNECEVMLKSAVCSVVGELTVPTVDVGMLSASDFGRCSADVVCVVGSCASVALGFRVVTAVSMSLGSLIDCPLPEGPSFVKVVVCWVWSELSVGEVCMSAPHELWYCTSDRSGDSVMAPGVGCCVVAVCESIKSYELAHVGMSVESVACTVVCDED